MKNIIFILTTILTLGFTSCTQDPTHLDEVITPQVELTVEANSETIELNDAWNDVVYHDGDALYEEDINDDGVRSFGILLDDDMGTGIQTIKAE